MSAPIRLATASNVVEGVPVVVGKDVLELLSTAMYVDPLSIYREYVQNAADAIDAARAEDRLTPQRRAFYEEMFGLIYENSQNRAAAKSLVERIMAKIA